MQALTSSSPTPPPAWGAASVHNVEAPQPAPLMVPPPPYVSAGPNVVFSDPAAGLERCIREAKAAVKGIKLHIALTHIGQCN